MFYTPADHYLSYWNRRRCLRYLHCTTTLRLAKLQLAILNSDVFKSTSAKPHDCAVDAPANFCVVTFSFIRTVRQAGGYDEGQLRRVVRYP